MAKLAAGLEKAARLARTVSRDDWAMASVHGPDGSAVQRFCTSDDAAVAAALAGLAAQAAGAACDLPDLDGAALSAAGRALAGQAGVRAFRAVRCGACVLAVASAAPRPPDAAVLAALEQIAGLCADAMAAAAPAATPQDFRQLFESVPGLYLVVAPDSLRIVAASDAYLDATMVTRAHILGRPIFDVFPDDPEDAEDGGVAALHASLRRVRETRLPDVMAVQRYPIRRPQEAGGGFALRYWSPVNSPVLGPDGTVLYIIHRVEDVTDYVLAHRPAGGPERRATDRVEAEIVLRSHELRRMADSLAQSEQRLRYVTRATNDVVWDWHMADDALWCSRGALEPFGSVLAHVTHLRDWEAAVHPDDRADVGASLRASVAARRENWAAEYRLRLPDGSERDVLHRGFLVIDEDGRPQRMVGSIADLTENKRQEARLRMQAEMLDYATDAILVRGLDHRVLYWNQAAAARYGWRSEQVIGRPVGDTLYAGVGAADFEHAMQALMRHGDYTGRMVHSAADGGRFVVHVHWILVRKEDGSPRAILSVETDLSERIVLERRLLQIQKLESLGRLTSGLAHDFNNWLTVIIGNAEELVEELAGQPALHDTARLIQMAGERGAELTRTLLAFGRRQPLTPEILAAGAAIEALRPLIARSLPETIDLQLLDTGHR